MGPPPHKKNSQLGPALWPAMGNIFFFTFLFLNFKFLQYSLNSYIINDFSIFLDLHFPLVRTSYNYISANLKIENLCSFAMLHTLEPS